MSRVPDASTDHLLLDDCPVAKAPAPAAPWRQWSQRLCMALAAAGTFLSLAGLTAAVIWAATADR